MARKPNKKPGEALRDENSKSFALNMQGKRKAKAELCAMLRRHIAEAPREGRKALQRFHDEVFASLWTDQALWEELIDSVNPRETPLYALPNALPLS